MQTATQIIMSIADLHTEQNHVEDKAKFLTHQQRSMVATAVKLAPMNSTLQLLMRVWDSFRKKSTLRWRIPLSTWFIRKYQKSLKDSWRCRSYYRVEFLVEIVDALWFLIVEKAQKCCQGWTAWCMYRSLQSLQHLRCCRAWRIPCFQ